MAGRDCEFEEAESPSEVFALGEFHGVNIERGAWRFGSLGHYAALSFIVRGRG
jgi:hypothetical protein